MLYDIVNPSDPYTIIADDLAVATIACSLLGHGQYSLKPLDTGGEGVPFFLFGGQDEWCTEKFGMDFEALMNDVKTNKSDALIACLESCVFGHEQDRKAVDLALSMVKTDEDRVAFEKFKAERQDSMRSSMNDIGTRASKWAEAIRQDKAGPSAPKQIFTA